MQEGPRQARFSYLIGTGKWRSYAFAILVSQLIARPANAQGLAGTSGGLSPVSFAMPQVAQATPAFPPQFIPTDITPYTVRERNVFNPGYKFKLFKALPERLWLTGMTEVSQRLDTNVLFTYDRPKADYAFRALPNLTVGYNVFKNTSIYGNYFVIKDVFARNYNNANAGVANSSINFPTTQSLAWGIQHLQPLGEKTTAQFNIQARELWLTSNVRFFDLIPGVTITREINRNNIIFASTLLQLRGSQYFVPANREIDPFYTLGYVKRQGYWTFIATDTFVTNFRRTLSVPGESNMSMIADLELNHPVSKRLPSLLAFMRAEPIWNWDSHKTPGISGFGFRFYGGLRFVISKPSYYGPVKDLRKKLMEAQGSSSRSPTSIVPNDNNNVSDTSNQIDSAASNTNPTSYAQSVIPLRGL